MAEQTLDAPVGYAAAGGGFINRWRSAPLRAKWLIATTLSAAAVLWCLSRWWFSSRVTGTFVEGEVPAWVRFGNFGLLAALSATALLSRRNALWLIGFSVTAGSVPLIQGLPFLREYTNVALLVSAPLFFLGDRAMHAPWIERNASVFVLAYAAISAVSTLTSYFIDGSIWQLKVGISYFVQLASYSLVLSSVCRRGNAAEGQALILLDGLVWGVLAQVVIAIAGIAALFAAGFVEGNDVVFGLSYYDRYKGTFIVGPVAFGMFFALAIPLVACWMLQNPARRPAGHLFLQLSPWIMMASGSRTARVVVLAVIAGMLVHKPTRRVTFLALPSVAIAYLVGFKYQSLPAAVQAALGTLADKSRDFTDRFFDINDRVSLSTTAVQSIESVSPIRNVIGIGAGSGGYDTSGYPAPHNFFLNTIAETGILGIAVLVPFFAVVGWLTFRRSRVRHPSGTLAWTTLIAFGVVMSSTVTYSSLMWPQLLVVTLLAAAVAYSQRSGQLVA